MDYAIVAVLGFVSGMYVRGLFDPHRRKEVVNFSKFGEIWLENRRNAKITADIERLRGQSNKTHSSEME